MSEANGEAILNSSGGLLAQHREQLMVGSGLSAETIAANGIRSETDHRRLKALLRWPTLPRKLGAALVIPFKRPDGTNGYCRAKFDSPRQRNNSDKTIK